ncbi:hypothetical protein E2C01_099948 [Portunus trituberculatus]|uniref:Uncharacterized protein n=1 Tax=Portunus trituberculatus TaxID=210409 RepID=A0A5B7KGP3_PORTR|nr:hypothetical protein [Portunus trituberculatus]
MIHLTPEPHEPLESVSNGHQVAQRQRCDHAVDGYNRNLQWTALHGQGKNLDHSKTVYTSRFFFHYCDA